MPKKSKVTILCDRGLLRLAWTANKKRYFLSTGLEDTKTNRVGLQPLILQIEADIEGGKEATPEKYKRQAQKAQPLTTCSQLFEQWLNSKIGISTRTVLWHRESLNKLVKVCGDISARDIGESEAKRFFLALSDVSKTTQRRRIETLKACWDWGISKELLTHNPWGKLPKIKPETPEPKPFDKEEVSKILVALEQRYPKLLPFIKFLLGTGCRIGEALALQVDDISQDFHKISISKQLTAGEIKLPKAGKKREIHVSDNIATLLKELKPINGFLFHDGTWTDSYIIYRWRPALKLAGVRYRSPYNCRHTFISHCLEAGMNPVKVAAITGHDVKVLLSHYAGLIDKPVIPELF